MYCFVTKSSSYEQRVVLMQGLLPLMETLWFCALFNEHNLPFSDEVPFNTRAQLCQIIIWSRTENSCPCFPPNSHWKFVWQRPSITSLNYSEISMHGFGVQIFIIIPWLLFQTETHVYYDYEYTVIAVWFLSGMVCQLPLYYIQIIFSIT